MWTIFPEHHFRYHNIRGFPKLDHSGSDVGIVLEQNKFSQKVASERDWTWYPGTLEALLLQHRILLKD